MKYYEIIKELKKINERLDKLEQKPTTKLFTTDVKEIVKIVWANASISTMEWKDIANFEYLRVGDYKTVTLKSGEEVKVYVANLNPLRFIFAIDGEYRMNDTNTNEGGWDKCRMRNVTMKHLWNLLPDDMKEYIVEHDGDILSLMSQEEYKNFDIFKEKKLEDLFIGHSWYWLKDAYCNNSYNFCYVYYDGSVFNYIANSSSGVLVCLAIK